MCASGRRFWREMGRQGGVKALAWPKWEKVAGWSLRLGALINPPHPVASSSGFWQGGTCPPPPAPGMGAFALPAPGPRCPRRCLGDGDGAKESQLEGRKQRGEQISRAMRGSSPRQDSGSPTASLEGLGGPLGAGLLTFLVWGTWGAWLRTPRVSSVTCTACSGRASWAPGSLPPTAVALVPAHHPGPEAWGRLGGQDPFRHNTQVPCPQPSVRGAPVPLWPSLVSGLRGSRGGRREHQAGQLAQCLQHHPAGKALPAREYVYTRVFAHAHPDAHRAAGLRAGQAIGCSGVTGTQWPQGTLLQEGTLSFQRGVGGRAPGGRAWPLGGLSRPPPGLPRGRRPELPSGPGGCASPPYTGQGRMPCSAQGPLGG